MLSTSQLLIQVESKISRFRFNVFWSIVYGKVWTITFIGNLRRFIDFDTDLPLVKSIL